MGNCMAAGSGDVTSSSTVSCPSRPPAPRGSLSPTTNAMLEFDGYYWWTNYPFGIPNPASGYYFNGQQWDPRCATVDANGMHMEMKKTQIPGAPEPQWSSVELVLWGKIAGNPNSPDKPPERSYPGYGNYLVAAQTTDFDNLANNCCFGVFTYQFNADQSIKNQHHELDMLECSRWGRKEDPTNAQFTLQPWEPQGNVHRITIAPGTSEITLVMDWKAEEKLVTFNVYYGLHGFDTLPSSSNITWTTSADQDIFIPDKKCQTVHFNLWRQPPQRVCPSENQHVTIKKFQFQPY